MSQPISIKNVVKRIYANYKIFVPTGCIENYAYEKNMILLGFNQEIPQQTYALFCIIQHGYNGCVNNAINDIQT